MIAVLAAVALTVVEVLRRWGTKDGDPVPEAGGSAPGAPA